MTSSASRGPILAIILVSYLMIILDVSVVITALPSIQHDLHFSEANLTWVSSAYTLAFGGLLLLGARAGDLLGHRRMFLWGLSVFTLTSLAISLAPSALFLLLARAVQGMSAAVLAPSTLALITINFHEGKERTRAVSYYGGAASVGASLGLVLGGVLTQLFSWRAGFFINVPIGIFLFVLALRYLNPTKQREGHFDLMGALTSTLGMTLLVYSVVRGASDGWSDPIAFSSFFGSVILLALFTFIESKAVQPILPLRLFKSPERCVVYVARMLFIGSQMGAWFAVTLFLQSAYGFSPTLSGLAYLPMTFANFLMSLYVPKLTARFGRTPLMAFGILLTLVGTFWLSHLSMDSMWLTGLAIPMTLMGFGQSSSLSTLTGAALVGVESRDAGAASGAVNVAHQLGGSLGLAVLAVVFAASGLGLPQGSGEQLTHQTSSLLLSSSILLLAAFVLILGMMSVRHGARKMFPLKAPLSEGSDA